MAIFRHEVLSMRRGPERGVDRRGNPAGMVWRSGRNVFAANAVCGEVETTSHPHAIDYSRLCADRAPTDRVGDT